MNDTQLLARLRHLDAASLADADKSIAVMDTGLRPVAPGLKMVGYARTVQCENDFLAVIQALDEAQENEVLVVDSRGSDRAVVGELFSGEAKRRGLSGIVVDGLVRDTNAIAQLAFPVFARGRCPISGTTQI
ncbi:MAG: RraA family protein, partial [Pseudomonadota bacterium]